MSLTLMYITNLPSVALIAEKYGVQRIWIDLESLGKEERQKNMDTVKSHHTVKDVEIMSKTLTTAELMVRINPWNSDSANEIEKVINAGAQRIMLPMWKTSREVKDFLNTVNNRARTTLLLETREAVQCIDEILQLPLLDEIHIGLNDLHLSYGLTFMFEPLVNGIIETLCKKMKNAGIAYGFGGIARIGEGVLSSEKIIIEHYRLGSTRVILSRSFCNTEKITDNIKIEQIFSKNLAKLRCFEESMNNMTEEDFLKNKEEITQCVAQIVGKIKETDNA